MAGGAFTRQVVAGIAVGIVIVAASVGAWVLYADSGDGGDIPSAAKIVISGPIDAIDSEVSFHPPAIRVLLDSNSTVIWINRNGTSVSLASSEGLFDVVIPPDESFSFTFGRPGIYEYFAKESGKTATIVVSTAEAEENRLAPVSLSKGSMSGDVYREMAETIAAAAMPQDEVIEMRLNNTRVAAYVTELGADIIVPKSMCHVCVHTMYDAIEYRTETGKLVLSQPTSESAAMNFSRQFMERIGYEIDGSEWVDAVDVGSRIDISFSQRVDGWIIPNHHVRFNIYPDHAWITVGKWYNNISSYDFGLGQEDAKPIAKEFMDSEVAITPELQKYGYADGSPSPDAWVEIFDDKVVYVVGIGYSATNPEYMDDKDHCGSPAGEGFDVLVDASSGRALVWRYTLCM